MSWKCGLWAMFHDKKTTPLAVLLPEELFFNRLGFTGSI